MIRAAFLGTPATAVPALAALMSVAQVELVVARPDAARGRSKARLAPPVKEAAREWGLTTSQPATADELHEAVESVDIDVGVVVAYGRLISARTLEVPEHGFVNLHFSLLPRWRGAAPVERAILEGDRMTGVSLMKLDEGLDTGPVIAEVETSISDHESGGALTGRLAALGAELLGQTLEAYVKGDMKPVPQLRVGAVHAERLDPEEARLTPRMDPGDFTRRVRAFHPRPGAWMSVDGERFGVVEAVPAPGIPVERGRITTVAGAVVAGLVDGAVELLTVKPAGRDLQSAKSWMNGRRGEPANFS